MASGHVRREFFVHLSSTFQNDQPKPLVLVFHEGEGNAKQIAQFSEFNTLSEKHGFLVIYPQAIDKHWNEGREMRDFRSTMLKLRMLLG